MELPVPGEFFFAFVSPVPAVNPRRNLKKTDENCRGALDAGGDCEYNINEIELVSRDV